MAETIDLTAGCQKNGLGGHYQIIKEIDCAVNNVGSGDTVQAIPISAHTLVQAVYWRVLTAEGGAATAKIGDGSDDDGFGASVDLNAATESWSILALTEGTPNTVTGYHAGKLYTADDTIDIIPSAALDAAKIQLRALCVDLS